MTNNIHFYITITIIIINQLYSFYFSIFVCTVVGGVDRPLHNVNSKHKNKTATPRRRLVSVWIFCKLTSGKSVLKKRIAIYRSSVRADNLCTFLHCYGRHPVAFFRVFFTAMFIVGCRRTDRRPRSRPGRSVSRSRKSGRRGRNRRG